MKKCDLEPEKTSATQLDVRNITNNTYQEIDMATGARNRRRAAPPRDSRVEELEGTKQLYTDYFGEVRRGQAHDYDANRRANIIYNIVHPKHGRWRGMEDPYRPGARAPSIYRSRAIFPAAIPQTPGRLGPKAKQRLQDAYSATFRLNQNFTPAHVTFRKILGYGGFGVAALFGLHDSTGRETTVVVKADLRPSTRNFIKIEKKHMISMSGARHVVQRTLLIAFPWPKDIPVRYDQFRAAERFAIKLGIFFLKVVSLFLLTTIQLRTIKIPNRLLINQLPLNQLPVNQAPLDQVLLDQVLLDQVLLDQVLLDHSLVDLSKHKLNKLESSHPELNQMLLSLLMLSRLLLGRLSMNQILPSRINNNGSFPACNLGLWRDCGLTGQKRLQGH
ncbi:hypothetical protein INS49_007398 [Diaporthe citri]|uniref:uncharacterized protein n=1 Tax=Diaporthe citri TaxID=83186 RepID=UPI001C7F3F6D|nr:uncharacterized protein INS49_007398 [Diaporthe citri]KAG6365787.1 hypothetical protein INS49_007398 [Diaporthe citri]